MLDVKDGFFMGSEVFGGTIKYVPKFTNGKNFIVHNGEKFFLKKQDLQKFIRPQKNMGTNAWRLFLTYFEPLDWEDKAGEGKLLEYEYFFPYLYEDTGTWNLNEFEESYFEVVRDMLEIICEGNHTFVMIPLTDHCIQKYTMPNQNGKQNSKSPYWNNSQGVKELYDPEALEYIFSYIDKMLYETKAYKNLIVWELGNEIINSAFAFSIFKRLIDSGVDPSNISLGINANIDDSNSLKVLRNLIKKRYGQEVLRKTIWNVHGTLSHGAKGGFGKRGFGKVAEWTMWWQKEPKKELMWLVPKNEGFKPLDIRIQYSTDGTGDGDEDSKDVHPWVPAQYRRRPSPAQWKKFLDYVLENYIVLDKNGKPLLWFEQFIKIPDPLIQVEISKVFSEMHLKYFGELPFNYGKFPEIENPEEIPPVEISPEGKPEEVIMPEKEKRVEFNWKFPFIHIKFNLLLQDLWGWIKDIAEKFFWWFLAKGWVFFACFIAGIIFCAVIF